MKLRLHVIAVAIFAATITPGITLACDGADPMTHIGNVTSVNAGKKTFTIKDAQTRSAITFAANTDIINSLKDSKGSIMVNYEEDGDSLTAIGITF